VARKRHLDGRRLDIVPVRRRQQQREAERDREQQDPGREQVAPHFLSVPGRCKAESISVQTCKSLIAARIPMHSVPFIGYSN
jgi:hypothetical protein